MEWIKYHEKEKVFELKTKNSTYQMQVREYDTDVYKRQGVYTVEEFDPDPFLDALDRYGLPRSESHDPKLVD